MKYLLTGITGHCCPHLAKILLKDNHEVHALVRETSGRLTDLLDIMTPKELEAIHCHFADFTKYETLVSIFQDNQFDGLFHLGAQSVVEEELIPIRKSKNMNYYTFKKLWNDSKKKNKIKYKNINGTDTEIIELNGKQTMALGFSHGMGQWKRITHITRHKYKGKVVKLDSKYGQVTVTPNHSVYDCNGNLSTPKDINEVFPIRKINYFSGKKRNSITLNNLEIKEEKLEDLLLFCSAYVAEGWANAYNRKNRTSPCYSVGIANNDLQWLEQMQKCIQNVFPELNGHITNTRKCKQLVFKNKTFCKLMIKLCGKYSNGKQIPEFLFYLESKYIKLFLNNLVFGDGTFRKRKTVTTEHYGTTSKKLACQIGLLRTLINEDYVIDSIYEKHKIWQHAYRVNQVEFYQLQQGNNLEKREENYDGYVYDLTVEDCHNFCAGLGNILVHNSHPPTSFKHPLFTLESNVVGTANLIEAIRLYNPECVICNVSTSEVYGDDCKNIGILTEDLSLHPSNPYGWSKMCAERHLRERCKNRLVKGFSTRAFSHCAPRRGKNFSISWDAYHLALMFIRQTSEKILPVGNLETQRVVIDARDVCMAYYKLMQRYHDIAIASDLNGESFNVCGPIESVKKMEYFTDKLIEISGLENVEKRIDERVYRPIDIKIQIGSTNKLKDIIKWEPTISIDTTLNDIYTYWVKKLK